MKLRIIALGHKLPAWANDAYADYARRMPRELAIDLVEIKPEPRGRGKTVEQMLATEAVRIAAASDAFNIVALDERGDAWTTARLAAALRAWHEQARNVAFVIGSADGLAASIKAGAVQVLALSALTLPHAIARVLLAEQLYRAVSLLRGHPYHRE